ncbi:MAG: hypothetical protein JST20_02530 [Bacteroidetes bacterium]|nr:hypothetical protein [Bacteroidota bacterium]
MSGISQVPYSSLVSQFQTGDIILFDGPSFESVVIEFVDKSPFSHVGIIVVDSSLSSKPLFWQSAGIKTMNDPLINGMRSGAQLLDLESVLAYVMKQPNSFGVNYSFCYRPLNYTRPSDFASQFDTYMRSVDGRAFPPTMEVMGYNYIIGQFKKAADRATYFCSQLASETYMEMGLIDSSPWPPNSYSPGNFSTENEKLPFTTGVSLGTEIPFSYP